MENQLSVTTVERITGTILMIRGKKVLVDVELASLYGVPTKVMLQAIKRNIGRFPDDFMFQLDKGEFEILRSQTVTSKMGDKRGGRRYLPYAFTEHGAIMVACVLNSPRAVAASVYVVRAFVKLREGLATHRQLAHKLKELERQIQTHDKAIKSIFVAIRQMMTPPQTPRRKIGFDLGGNW